MTTLTTLANRIRYEAGLMPGNTPASREQRKRLLEIARLVQAESGLLYAVLDAARESIAECNAARDEGGYSSSDCSGCEAFNLCAALDAYDAEGGENE